jgi:hypothetical protein
MDEMQAEVDATVEAWLAEKGLTETYEKITTYMQDRQDQLEKEVEQWMEDHDLL